MTEQIVTKGIKNLITVNLVSDDPNDVSQLENKPIVINLRYPKKVQEVPTTKIEDLKWEPVVEVMPFIKLIETKQTEVMELALGDVNFNEMQSAISTSKDDNVMLVATASDAEKIIGFSLLNAWQGQTANQGALFYVLAPEYKQKGVDTLLIKSILDEAGKLLYVDTIQQGMTINHSKRFGFIAQLLAEYGYTPSPYFD